MKTCTRCKQKKPFSAFNFKIKSKGLLQYHCRECSRKYVRTHYRNNREYYLKKANKRNNMIRKKIREYIINYLNSHSCVDCGEQDPNVLEFDHIGNKNFSISNTGRDKTLETVQIEIAKCEVRCANCHRRKTALKAGWDKRLPL